MTKIPAIFRESVLAFEAHVSPRVRSRKLAAFALDRITEAKRINAGPDGEPAPHRQIVDGREGAPLASVKPDGVIVAKFDLLQEVLTWIAAELEKASPRRSGAYAQSHVLFVDGVEQATSAPLVRGSEYAFVNLQPYARKIERGLSKQAPDGVYEAIASVADDRFGNIADIRFTFRAPSGAGMEARFARKRGMKRMASEAARAARQPAVVVRPR